MIAHTGEQTFAGKLQLWVLTGSPLVGSGKLAAAIGSAAFLDAMFGVNKKPSHQRATLWKGHAVAFPASLRQVRSDTKARQRSWLDPRMTCLCERYSRKHWAEAPNLEDFPES